MQLTLDDKWRPHDGFGLLVVAVIVFAAVVVGYVTAVP
jgi:hypothetical protein